MGGFKAKRPPRIGFVDEDDRRAFGFVDPAQFIRSVYLTPAFKYGYTSPERSRDC